MATKKSNVTKVRTIKTRKPTAKKSCALKRPATKPKPKGQRKTSNQNPIIIILEKSIKK